MRNIVKRPHLTQKVLVAYAPQDAKWLEQIEMAVLREVFTHWEKWDVSESHPFPPHADLLLLLVSADLMDALTIEQQERLRDFHQKGISCCIGIMLRPTFWYGDERPLQVLPLLPPDGFGGAKPLTEWKERNIPFALEEIQQGLLKFLESLESVQLKQMNDFLQELSSADQHRIEELKAQGLYEHLFAMCERLQVEEPELIAPIYVQLAAARKHDSAFAQRCLQQAGMLGYRA